jgi:hypothetical protein
MMIINWISLIDDKQIHSFFIVIVISVFCKDSILIKTESLQYTVLFFTLFNKGKVAKKKRKEISWDLVKMLKDTEISVASISTVIKPLRKMLYNDHPIISNGPS